MQFKNITRKSTIASKLAGPTLRRLFCAIPATLAQIKQLRSGRLFWRYGGFK